MEHQFLTGVAHTQKRPDTWQQQCVIDRAGHYIIRTGIQCSKAGARGIGNPDRDDCDRGGLRFFLQFFAKSVAILCRIGKINHNQVRAVGGNHDLGIGAGPTGIDRELRG